MQEHDLVHANQSNVILIKSSAHMISASSKQAKSSDGLKLNELTSFLSAMVLCWDEQILMKSKYNSKIN